MTSIISSLTHGGSKLPWVSITLAATSLVLFAVFGGKPEAFIYDRELIENGEFWRLATGHFVHLDHKHLLMNVGALFALGFLYETSLHGGARRLVLGCFILSGSLISFALFLGDPKTQFYCGLSAILNTLYVVTMVAMWRETRSRVWLVGLGLLIAKTGYEALFGSILSDNLEWPPHIGAHLTGILAGILLFVFGLFEKTLSRLRQSDVGALRPSQAC
ncbi:rhomboid family GlyGly-CTERM serine protease [Labrenzia sp. EL_208]|nr:rhomboid family GlyGly-CTERM serine protease [Labrenzia sp. EL_132]MBG6230909.1 rhomboid family GlyGly-CTERM serine protease [Labrenzia sp. EL_208]